jgi:hypothetical protein
MQTIEELKLYVVEDKNDNIPKLKTKEGVSRPLENIKAVVIHDTEAPRQSMLDVTIPWLVHNYGRTGQSFHYAVTETGELVEILPPNLCAIAVGSLKYTRFATDYFGDTVCPRYRHTKETPHFDSPNSCTVNLLIPMLDEAGSIDEPIHRGIVKILAYIFNRYCDYLTAAALEEQGLANLLRVGDIVESKSPKGSYIPNPHIFYKKEDFFHRTKVEVEKLRAKWAEKYPTTRLPQINKTIIAVKDPVE